MIKRKLLIGLGICMTLSLTSMPVFAAETVNTDVSAGSLSITPGTIGTLSAVPLTGIVQTSTGKFGDTTIIDATGSGAGWNVNISASALTNTSAPASLQSLPANSLAITAPTVVAGDGASEDSPTNIVKNSGTIDNGVTGVKVLSAIQNQGMGTYTAALGNLTLTLNPKDAYVGTYSTTITTAITSTP